MSSDLPYEIIYNSVISAENVIVLIKCTNRSRTSDSFLHKGVLLDFNYIFDHVHLSIKVHKQELKLIDDISHKREKYVHI